MLLTMNNRGTKVDLSLILTENEDQSLKQSELLFAGLNFHVKCIKLCSRRLQNKYKNGIFNLLNSGKKSNLMA
jgi:hypothetical protein